MQRLGHYLATVQAVVRPYLECCALFCWPSSVKDVINLERMQKVFMSIMETGGIKL